MGTNRRYRGEIEIDPPLNWAEIRKVFELPRIKSGWEIKLVIDEETKETDDGSVVVRTSNTVVPWTDDAYRGYYVQEALQEVIDACPGHTFTGFFEGVLEDGSEMWRIVVTKDGAVKEVQPTISWPET